MKNSTEEGVIDAHIKADASLAVAKSFGCSLTIQVLACRDRSADLADALDYVPPEALRGAMSSEEWEEYVQEERDHRRRLVEIREIAGHYKPFVYRKCHTLEEAREAAREASELGFQVLIP